MIRHSTIAESHMKGQRLSQEQIRRFNERMIEGPR